MDVPLCWINLSNSKRFALFCHMRKADNGRIHQEAAAPSPEKPFTCLRSTMSNDDTMEGSDSRIGKRERKTLGTSWIKKEPVRVSLDPSFSTPYLFCWFTDSTLEPPLPVELFIVPIRIDTVLIRKDNDVVLEYYKKVTNLLANFCSW